MKRIKIPKAKILKWKSMKYYFKIKRFLRQFTIKSLKLRYKKYKIERLERKIWERLQQKYKNEAFNFLNFGESGEID